jgi:T5SS/PEP-CTERM-associated repeat protein
MLNCVRLKRTSLLVFCGAMIWAIFASQPTAYAQFTANFQTNIISGVVSNWTGSYVVGSNNVFDALLIQNSGVLSDNYGYLGYEVNSRNNMVLVTGSGSVWTNSGPFWIGYSGSGNSLVISNGGQVFANYTIIDGDLLIPAAFVGGNVGSTSNTVVVTGGGSVWSNNGPIKIGYEGSGNSLVIAEGGRVFGSTCFVGNYGSSNNTASVTGTGSVLVSDLYVGYFAAGNNLIVTNGGQVSSLIGQVGGMGNNGALVSGPGSAWSIGNGISVGGGSGNSLVVSNGGGVADTYGSVDFRSNQVVVTGTGSSWSNSVRGYVGSSTSSSNNSVRVADSGICWNGVLHVGYQGSSNSLVVDGGLVSATNLVVGFAAITCDNFVRLDSGNVVVTNANTNAVLEVRRGEFILNNGNLRADRLVITNACSRFIRNGGTLSITTTNLDPNLSAVGDGIPNGWKQQYGLDPFDPNLANEDPDGDGFSNLQEYLAGTDPNNSASAFRITSITRVSTNLLITWQTGIGKTNALERTTGVAGSFSNNFAPIFTATNAVGTTTNYLDIGAATNVSAFYYRVKLVP